MMHTYNVAVWAGALAGGTQDVFGCRCSDGVSWLRLLLQAGLAEQVTAGETIDRRHGLGINAE